MAFRSATARNQTRGRISLRLEAMPMGRDLCVALTGGDRPHAGAVALGRPGAEPDLLELPSHREGPLAAELAGSLARELGVAVVVACGIHLEAITREEIAEVQALAREMAAGFAAEWKAAGGTA